MIQMTDTGRGHHYTTVGKQSTLKILLSLIGLIIFHGQTSWAQTPLNIDGQLHRVEHSGDFEDFVIPNDTTITQVVLTAKGGDGGTARVEKESCTSPSGSGASFAFTLDIGDGPNQVPRGTLLRFIVGGKGTNGFTESDFLGTGASYGGGGGGTGILIKTPDTTFMNILAVAGGGGGAYVGRIVGFCVNNGAPAEGQGGRDYIEAGDGKGGFLGGTGGSFGDGGKGSEFAGGGGGLLTTGGGVTCVEIAIPPTTYQAGAGQKGYPEGGRGGLKDDCIGILRVNAGGFGFGGGGAGWGAGGGGGGYSGGGGGATTGGGGGGGSFVNSIASDRVIAMGGVTKSPQDGFIEYQVIRKKTDAPLALCKDVNVTLDNTGLAILDATETNDGSTDSDGGDLTFSVSQDTFNCTDLGEKIIILTVMDDTGLSGQCNTKITITDSQAPEVVCPEDIKVDNAPGTCGANFDFTDLIVARDNCEANLSFSHPADSLFELGETTVTVTAIDPAGNEANCSFTIQVNDTETAQLTCPQDMKINNDSGTCGATIDFSDLVEASDNCELELSFSNQPGSFFELGETTVQITATEAGSNELSCSFIIKVIDTEAPQITCPENISFNCGQLSDLEDLAGTASATDNCEGVTIQMEDTQLPLTCEVEFSISRVWKATDLTGNETSCTQLLTRLPDETAPECLNCPENITVSCESIPSIPTTLDLVDDCDTEAFFTVTEEIVELDAKCSDFNYELFRTFLVQDHCGNTQEYVQKIKVVDDTAPVFECLAENIVLSCLQSSDPEEIGSPLVIDNCDPSPQLNYEDVITGNCSFECTIVRTWTATDACGNSSQCVQTIMQSNRGLIEEALTPDIDEDGISDPIVLGVSNRTLTIGPDALDCIIQWLPHRGGPAIAMPRGAYITDPVACLPGPNPLGPDGRIESRLLGEMLEMAIKLRLNPEMGKTLVRDLDCQFSVMVTQTLRPYSNINSIFHLGNITLANLYGPFYEPIASAIQCINNLYPLCTNINEEAAMINKGWRLDTNTNLVATGDRLTLYPNPANKELFVHAPQLQGKPAVLRIYNLQGQLAAEQRLSEWPAEALRLSLDQRWQGAYILQVFTDGKAVQSETFIVQQE